MKKIFMSSIVVLMLIAFSSVAFARTYQNEPDGFRGITWGTDFETVKDQFILVDTDSSYGGLQFYTRVNDEMTIGSASLESVNYVFWQNKFAFSSIGLKSYKNWTGVQNALESKFGNGFQPNDYISNYYWLGDITVIQSKYNKIQDTGLVTFVSRNIRNQMEEWEKAQAAAGAKKGF